MRLSMVPVRFRSLFFLHFYYSKIMQGSSATLAGRFSSAVGTTRAELKSSVRVYGVFGPAAHIGSRDTFVSSIAPVAAPPAVYTFFKVPVIFRIASPCATPSAAALPPVRV